MKLVKVIFLVLFLPFSDGFFWVEDMPKQIDLEIPMLLGIVIELTNTLTMDGDPPLVVIADGGFSPLTSNRTQEILEKKLIPTLLITLPYRPPNGEQLYSGHSKILHHLTRSALVIGFSQQDWKALDKLSKSFEERIVLIIDPSDEMKLSVPDPLDSRSLIIRSNRTQLQVCPGNLKIRIKSLSNQISTEQIIKYFKSCPGSLKRHTPRISTTGNPPHVLMKDDKMENGSETRLPVLEPGTKNPLGSDFDLVNLLCTMLGTKHFELYLNPDYDTYQPSKKRWTGKASDVLYGRSDFSVGFVPYPKAVMLMVDSVNYVNYQIPGYSGGHPKPMVSLFNVIKPFNGLTWGCILLVLVTTMATFQLIYFIHKKKIRTEDLPSYGFWDIPLQTLESLVEFRMINFFGPRLASAKVLRGFYMLFGAFMVMAYSSMLRSALVAVDLDKPVTSSKDVADRGVVAYVPKDGNIARFWRKWGAYYPFKQILQNWKPYDFKVGGHFKPVDDIYDKSFTVVTSEMTSLYMYYPWDTKHGFQKMHFAPRKNRGEFTYINMRKGRSFKRDMTRAMLLIQAMGFYEHFLWKRLPIEAKDYGVKPPPPNETPLTIENTAFCFFILITGLLVSSGFFMVEKVFRDKQWLAPV